MRGFHVRCVLLPPSSSIASVLANPHHFESSWRRFSFFTKEVLCESDGLVDALALSSLYLNKVEVVCMWDLGCTPPALVESSKLQQWNEARVSAGLDPLTTTYFDTPRKISGIGSDATTIIGSVMLPLTFQSRPGP